MALDASQIAFAQSKLFEGIAHAEHALRCAMVSGHARTRAGAIANIGLLSLYAGDLPRAEKCLHEGLQLGSNLKELLVPLLDNYAQLELVKGELEACESLLRQVDTYTPSDKSFRSSWCQLVTYPTRIRVLQRRLEWEESLRLADEGIALATSRSDGLHGPVLGALKAEALTALGRLKEAAAVIAEVTERCDGTMLAATAEVERVTGQLSVKTGKHEAARHHFQRALRMVRTVGNLWPRIDTASSYVRELLPADERTNATHGGRLEDPQVLIENQSSAADDDSAVARVDPTEPEPRAPGLGDVMALLEFALSPELFAREAFALLRDTRGARAMALIASQNGHPMEVLECLGWSRTEARAVARSTQPSNRLALGECRGRKFYLLIEAGEDLESRSSVVALRKLVKTALALETFRKDEKQRGSLWPLDTPHGKDDGVYVADNTTRILAIARQTASSSLPVLITGETGTGKELLARAIHNHFGRADRPFIPYNCKGVARDVLDSHLFGHRRGAFTGAQDHAPGVIRAAQGGTLLLDEIGELDLDVQPKLLRLLDTGEIHPLGEPKPIQVDVRIIAATNANIDQLVTDGRFREDLFYRLNVIRLRTPSLRERREEIPPLIHYFLQRYGHEQKKRDLTLADDTLEYLLLYAWPGNVRQLANEIRRLIALSGSETTLRPELLSPEILASRRTVPAPETAPAEAASSREMAVRIDQPLAAAVQQVERAMLFQALHACGGRVEPAARMLGFSRKGLFLKRRRYGFDDLAMA